MLDAITYGLDCTCMKYDKKNLLITVLQIRSCATSRNVIFRHILGLRSRDEVKIGFAP